ncbi:MAG: nucleotidyltransferase family protein [Actinomycetota bacterium]|nr:nucleotidyltransferase family protein [Actinomycetota bacterium]MDA3028181.1 nucleotidyltransferase family protein [Actinomycetota bacterium]
MRRQPSLRAAVLLAAGAGSRFEGPSHKLLADVHGQPVWKHALDAVLASEIELVVVVTGAGQLPDLEPIDPRVTSVHNPAWTSGQASSLRVGIETAAKLGADSVVIGLADQPGVTPDAWDRIARSRSPLAVALYGEHRGHPVLITSEYWAELPHAGDLGARDILSKHVDSVEAIPCNGSPDDIDTEKDLQRWLRRSPTNSP